MPVDSPDPADGRAVFLALQRRVDGALEGWRCLRAVPRIDGTVYFDLESSGRQIRLNWVGSRVTSSDVQAPVQQSQGVLDGCLQDEDFSLLWLYNRELSVLRFDDRVVDTLLAGRFTPGVTSWFDYRFDSVFQESANKFQIAFAKKTGRLVFEVKAAGSEPDGRAPLFENRLFAMYLEEDCRSSEDRGQVAHQVERFLGFLLNRAVHQKMGLELEGGGRPGGGPISSGRWGSATQWYQFFSDHEIECSNLCSLQLSDPFSWVNHGELECMDHEPPVLSATVGYANTPWVRGRTLGPPGTRFLVSRLGEEEVVRGGQDRLEATLDRALNNPQARFVCVSNTCLPKIIGDDVASLVARRQSDARVPILLLNNDLSSPDLAFENLVLQAIRQFAGEEDQEPRAGINLVGFPPGREELIAGLEDISIAHNVNVLPEIGSEILRGCAKAELSVAYPFAPWLRILEGGLGEMLKPVEVLPAPYGFRRTREWFETLARRLGREDGFAEWEKRWAEPLADQWSRLTDQAGEFGLAFVVGEGTAQRLVDAERHYGFEMLPLFEEMGFRLHVLIHTVHPDQTLPVERFTTGLAEPGRHSFRGFSGPQELSSMLENPDFQAVYSEVFYDDRILRAGQAQFRLSMIEMGLQGALRSLKRLLGVCRLPFYRRYRSYL